MIWGEVVNSVRSIHLSLLHEFSIDPKLFLKDIEFADAETLIFPRQVDDFEEWDELIPAQALEDILPFHPIERVLLEGPLLPIQKVEFQSKVELEELFRSILHFEKEWAKHFKLLAPPTEKFLERACAAQALKLSTRLGFSRLGAV
jgi:hypothetical protein